MGVVISKPAINLREQLTELKATQGYEERQFHFDNLVTNGTFDTDVSGWTTVNGSTVSFDAGTMLIENTAAASGGAQQAITTEVGKTYVASMDLANGAAFTLGLEVRTSPTTGVIKSTTTTASTDTLILTFTATTTTTYVTTRLTSADPAALYNVDNVSVYTSDGTDVAFTMPKGWKPLHVYDDGALQKEGSGDDYEVTYDGFIYTVSFAVAPANLNNIGIIGVRA